MARVLKGSQFYLHTPHTSANRMNHTCLCLPGWSWRDGRPSWSRVAGWLHTEISVPHRELNLATVAHPLRTTKGDDMNWLVLPPSLKFDLLAGHKCAHYSFTYFTGV